MDPGPENLLIRAMKGILMKQHLQLTDQTMRPLLFDRYESSGAKLRFFEEFCLGRKTRADLLLVTETELVGFEIKSDKDTLERLERQIHDYERFCDRNYLVVGQKLEEKALPLLPAHWGAYRIYMTEDETLHLECIREAEANKKRMRLHNQLRLLWRSELIPIMRKYQLGGVTKKNKLEMVRKMEHSLSKDRLKEELTEALIQRDYTLYQSEEAQKDNPC